MKEQQADLNGGGLCLVSEVGRMKELWGPANYAQWLIDLGEDEGEPIKYSGAQYTIAGSISMFSTGILCGTYKDMGLIIQSMCMHCIDVYKLFICVIRYCSWRYISVYAIVFA